MPWFKSIEPYLIVLLCPFFAWAGSNTDSLKYFPIDSSQVLRYRLNYGWLLSGPHYAETETVTKMKSIAPGKLSMNVETDSSGVKRSRIDTCLMDSSRIICGSEMFHYSGGYSGISGINVSNYIFKSERYLHYDSTFAYGGNAGGSKNEWYEGSVGLIKYSRISLAGVDEYDFTKILTDVNGIPMNTDSLISVVVKDGEVGLARYKSRRKSTRPFFEGSWLNIGDGRFSILGKHFKERP